jgi:hypothetical protein
MMMETNSPDPLRARRRLAEEWLLESSSWRDNLDDTQGQRLANWARDYINSVITGTAVLTDDEAEEILEETVTAVLRIMRGLNNLVPAFSQLDEESARRQLQDFNADLQTAAIPPIPSDEVEQLLAQRQSLDTHTAFDAFYTLLNWRIEDHNTEEEE